MAILTLDEYKKKQQEQTPIKYTQGTNKSSILTFDEYKKTNDYQTLKSTYKNNSSANTLESYKRRKKELENQLLNYKREEKNPWWDKNDNIIENVGNVVYKLFGEKKEERYKKDKQYDALEKEYADINKKIDDYLVKNKTYDKGLLGYAQKSADVTAGNVRTSIDGINSTILKATGQKPVVYDSYAERVANKAISQSKGAEKVGLEITSSVARMVPQMLMPTKTASYVMGFANYGGSAYNQAKKEGYDEDKATLYGMTIGGLEMGLQGLLGGLDNIYGSSIAGRATDKIMRKIITNPTLRSYITKVGGEFTEEYLQEFLNPIVRNVILEEENGADFWNQAGMENKVKQFAKNFFNKDNLYAGALGGLTSGIMDSPALFVNNQANSNSNNTKPTVPTVQEVVAQENTKKEQGTGFSTAASSFNEEAISPTSDALIALNKTSETDGTLVSSIANNIAQSNESVNLSTNQLNNNVDENIVQTKGNIPINKALLNKYSNVSQLMNSEINNYDGQINVKTNINELSNLDLESSNSTNLYHLASNIFKNHNTKTTFYNNGNKIEVSNGDIKESINKIMHNSNQKKYLKEHLQIFSDLGDIIESATLSSQNIETKTRENNKVWSYYLNGLNIDGNTYLFEFDVVSRSNGENHYRVQRLLKKADASAGNTVSNSITPTLETSASYDNNSTTSSKSQIVSLPTTNNTQNIGNNTNNMSSLEKTAPPMKRADKNQLGYIPKDPTKESSYDVTEKVATILEERPVTIEDKESWLKKLLTIKTLDKGYYVDKLARQKNNKELSSKYDYMLMANGIAQQVIGNEQFNPKTQKSAGAGLHKIFEPIENSGKLQEFSEYMYHKHNISRMSLDTNYQEDNKPIFGDSIDAKYSKNIVKKYENENPEFIEWSEKIYDYNNFLLDVLVDYGVISSADKSYYNKKYPHYVPTIRATDKAKIQMDFVGKKASVNVPIKVAKGGNQDIIPLKEAMALRTMQTMNSALRNNFGNELLNTIKPEVETTKTNTDEVIGDDLDVEELLTKSTKKSSATLTVFKNGEKVTFNINDEIYEALAPSNRYKIKVLNSISKFRRAVTTEFSPAFMLTNPIKDIQDGTLNSKHPTLFIKNIPEAISQVKNKGEFYKLYMANGGGYETYFNYGEGYNKIPQKRKIYDPRKILDKISEINQEIEMTPRLAEFIASLEAGDNIETSVYNSQEITTNFKRGGDWTKNLDANGATFLNAQVQGTVKQVRNVQEAKVQGIRGMTNLAVKWSIAGLTPYILSQLMWGDDDEYEELSEYVKNNYYILWKNEDGTFVRIPKGRVMSVIQNLFKQPLDALKGEKIDIKEFLDLLQNQVLPSDPAESNIISPIIDVMQNKTWYGGDLVPQRLQSLPEEEQYDESTDAISIWIGKKTGISPIKINYILDQYSGAIGDIILPALTLEAENDSNTLLSYLTAPLKDKFTTNSVMNNQNISDLYNLDDELTKKAKSSNATSKDILKSKYINTIQTEMNKLTKEQRNIQMDKHLTNNEKYKQVKEIQKKINKLAKKGLNNYENITSYSNYGKVAEEEYYLNSKNEWTKVNDKEKEALSNIKMNATDKNKYFKTKVQIGVIKSDDDKDSTVKHTEIANLVINSSLSDEYKGYLYGKYYSSEKVIKSVLDAGIKFDEFIKFNSQEFTTDYYTNGKAVTNSRRNKVIKYVNSLNLSVAQKAILIKLEYSSYTKYDKQIVSYINKMNYSKFEKASLLKSFGFDYYDKYLISYVNNMNITKSEKEELLKEMGFTIRNGRVYS